MPYRVLSDGSRGLLEGLRRWTVLIVAAILAQAAAAAPEADESSAPSGLAAADITTRSVILTWKAATGGVTGYRLYEYVKRSRSRSGWALRIDDIAKPSVRVEGLNPGSLHKYALTVIDGAGRESHKSAPVTITTLQPPRLDVPASGAEGAVYAVAGEVFRHAVAAMGLPAPSFLLVEGPQGMGIDPRTGILQWAPPGGAEGTATVTVRATNSVGSDERRFSFTVYPAGTDRQAPNPVRHPLARAVTATGCTLIWPRASDNVGVAGYYMLAQEAGRGHSLMVVGKSAGPATTYTVTNLKAGTEYRIWVAAYDAVGNRATISGMPPAHILTKGAKANENEIPAKDAHGR